MATTFSPLPSTTREVVRFADQDTAWTYIQMMAAKQSFRVADYGYGPNQAEPYWVATDHLLAFSSYPQEELDRWKACGRTRL